jgi:hypothetical protein
MGLVRLPCFFNRVQRTGIERGIQRRRQTLEK